jgi:FkbM family methyltransferase
MKKIIDSVRHFVNEKIGSDIVRFAGQHNLRSHLYKVIEEYQIDTFLDVGANEGQFGSFLRSIGFSGNIYSFEPVADAFKKIAAVSSLDEKWYVYNFALGSSSGESQINVSKHTSFSSLLTPSDYALERWSSSHVDHMETITVKTLDYFFKEENISGTNIFLKMDTQGYDLEVFKGATQSLSRVQAVLSEISLIAVYNDMPNYKQSLSTFEAAGFSVSGLYPITRNKDLSLNEVDCVLVNTASHEQVKK